MANSHQDKMHPNKNATTLSQQQRSVFKDRYEHKNHKQDNTIKQNASDDACRSAGESQGSLRGKNQDEV